VGDRSHLSNGPRVDIFDPHVPDMSTVGRSQHTLLLGRHVGPINRDLQLHVLATSASWAYTRTYDDPIHLSAGLPLTYLTHVRDTWTVGCNDSDFRKENLNPCIIVIVPGSVAITYITHFRQQIRSYSLK